MFCESASANTYRCKEPGLLDLNEERPRLRDRVIPGCCFLLEECAWFVEPLFISLRYFLEDGFG